MFVKEGEKDLGLNDSPPPRPKNIVIIEKCIILYYNVYSFIRISLYHNMSCTFS